MKKSDLGIIQIIILITVVLYIILPDLFAGPADDSALFMIAGLAEAVLAVIRIVSPSSVPEQECISNEFYSEDNFSDDDDLY